MESWDRFRLLEVREKARNVFRDEPRHYTTSHLHQVFLDFSPIFSLFSLVFCTFKLWSLRNLIKQLFPFALVGYETGYSQLGASRLVG